MTTAWFAIVLQLVAAVANAVGGFFFKKSSSSISLSIISLIKNKFLILGVFFYGLSTIIGVPGLRYGELSVLYPLIATAYIWVTILGVKYLDEKLSAPKIAAICFILLGVLFIGIGA